MDEKYAKYIGKKYGRATIQDIEKVIKGAEKRHETNAICLCDCGNVFATRLDRLISGGVKSCGCLHREVVSANSTRHGKSTHPLYKTWHNMRSRCDNPNATKYEIYGGRGITVCDEWEHSFEAFYDWSISNGWEKGLTIDRINTDKGYSPDNCRWTDYYTQNNNLRSNHNITYNGECYSIYEWARRLHISKKALSERVRRGWSVERTFNTP